MIKPQVVLFVAPHHPESEQAKELVMKGLRKNTYVIRRCPAFMKEDDDVPFIADSHQRHFSGLQGIKYFLEHQQELV